MWPKPMIRISVTNRGGRRMAARPLDPFVDVLIEVELLLCAAASGAHSYDKIRLMRETIAHASQA